MSKAARAESTKGVNPAVVSGLAGFTETFALPTSVPSWGAATRAGFYPLARVGVLVATDVTSLFGAALFAYVTWAYAILGQPIETYFDVAPLLLLFPIGYAAADLYPGFGIGAVETLRRLSYCTTLGFLAIAASSFAFKLPSDHSRVTFLTAWAAALIVIPTARFLILSLVAQAQWWCEPAVLVGSAPWLEETIRSLKRAKSIGFRPVAVIADNLEAQAVLDVPVLSEANAGRYLSDDGIRTAVVSDSKRYADQIPMLQQRFRHVIVIQPHGRTPVERVRAFNLGGVLGIEFTNNLLGARNRILKRLMDVIVGGSMLTLAIPCVALGSIFVKLRSRGSAFYVQEREGYQGRPVKIRKLRTMQMDAEHRLLRLLDSDPQARDEWERSMKLRKDPRIIPGGHFLRRFSLDELPQLWDVIKGDLSLVGPRPFPSYHTNRFSRDFRQLRRQVRPGLTGMWQVMSRSDGGMTEQELYDRYYIQNWSLWLDIYILARTLFVVIGGRGAY